MKALRSSWEKNWPELRCAAAGGMPAFVTSRRSIEDDTGVPVFCYHLVTHASFERDLSHLSQGGYVTLDADALLAHVRGERAAPRKAVVLSFDDGAVNLYRVVYPLLQRFSMKAVAFIAPRFHGNTNDATDARCCTWDELREMHASGVVDVQSHTYSHRYVPRWPEPAMLLGPDAERVEAMRGEPMDLAEDLSRAKQVIETRLDKHVRHLAFPRYNGSAAAIEVGRSLGYEAFWWGVLPHRPLNRPGDPATHIVRLSGEFVRRLPGPDRRPLTAILAERYGSSLRRVLTRR